MRYLPIVLISLYMIAYINCEYTSFGLGYRLYPVGRIDYCSDTLNCHESFEKLRNNSEAVYVCFEPDLDDVCRFNQTINDNTTYVSFCLIFDSVTGKGSVVENTIQDNDFLSSLNNQCD